MQLPLGFQGDAAVSGDPATPLLTLRTGLLGCFLPLELGGGVVPGRVCGCILRVVACITISLSAVHLSFTVFMFLCGRVPADFYVVCVRCTVRRSVGSECV